MSRGRHFFRARFTIIELLVGITSIAILIALLLPAVQQRREAGKLHTNRFLYEHPQAFRLALFCQTFCANLREYF